MREFMESLQELLTRDADVQAVTPESFFGVLHIQLRNTQDLTCFCEGCVAERVQGRLVMAAAGLVGVRKYLRDQREKDPMIDEVQCDLSALVAYLSKGLRCAEEEEYLNYLILGAYWALLRVADAAVEERQYDLDGVARHMLDLRQHDDQLEARLEALLHQPEGTVMNVMTAPAPMEGN